MTLVFVEHQDGRPDEVSLQAVALARSIAGDGSLEALLAGPGAADAALALGAHGVARAYVAEHDGLAVHAPVALARCIIRPHERSGRSVEPFNSAAEVRDVHGSSKRGDRADVVGCSICAIDATSSRRIFPAGNGHPHLKAPRSCNASGW